MTDRLEALEEVTLAIARAAAERDPTFADKLGTRLRVSLHHRAHAPAVFQETFNWLLRFEGGGTVEQASQDAGATCLATDISKSA